MADAYSKIGWENSPSEKTPINMTNLNHMDEGIVKNRELISQLEGQTADLEERVAYIEENGVIGGGGNSSGVEPEEDDIPKVFFGGDLPQTKTDTVMPFRYISKTMDIDGYCTTKAQGNSTMSKPKKNQTVKMYKDANCTEKLKVDFKGWGEQYKHCYKANWNDLTHARNVVSARLWADVVKSRSDYDELPELLRTSPNQGAVDGFPVKVYANGIYQGRYTLNIPKDKWTFNMDDGLDEHCVLCGEGYVSGCFKEVSMAQWTDEIHDTCPSSIQARWLEIIDFVMNSTDESFVAGIESYFDINSLIDYHLFGLVSCGLDAYGKNQLYATYDGKKWYATMYDMDLTWGLHGDLFESTDYDRTSYEDYKVSGGNTLYVRLESLFYKQLYRRWQVLKNNPLSIVNIINRFERFTDIAPNELVVEDFATTTGGGAFTGIPLQDSNNIQQIRAYALARLKWTDDYITALLPDGEVPCTGITLSATNLTFTSSGSQTLTATVTPSNTTDVIEWSSSNPNVATVVNGKVTALVNGNVVITATCGGYSATCNVAISGIVEPIPCTGITLSTTEMTLELGETQTLTATVVPSDTTDVVEWSSSNTSYATVVDGKVTGKATGNVEIIATCGSMTATCTVKVNPEVNYLDGVAYTYGVEPNRTTGVMTSVTGQGSFDKVTLPYSGRYSFEVTGRMPSVFLWDENDNYLGVFYRQWDFIAKAGWKVVVKTTAEEGIDYSDVAKLVRYTAEEVQETISIDLSELTWTTTGSDAYADIYDYGIVLDSIVNSNIGVKMGHYDGYSTNKELLMSIVPSASNCNLYIYGMNADKATSYFTENPTTLILNG